MRAKRTTAVKLINRTASHLQSVTKKGIKMIRLTSRRVAQSMLARRSVRAVVPAGVRGFMSGDVASVIDGGAPHVDKNSESYLKNVEEMNAACRDLEDRLAKVRAGGGAEAVAKHVSRDKLLARERVDKLLDPGSPFLELSPLAGEGLYGKDEVPSGGVVTGVGRIQGLECVIVANDVSSRVRSHLCLFLSLY